MASTSDIRDIMNMGHDGQRPAVPKKKKKLVEAQPRLSGISREVQALMGDSVPPVAIVEAPKYKSKPSLATKAFKPRHWEECSFQHGARQDGLILQHWKRALPGTGSRPQVNNATTPTDVEMTDGEKEPSTTMQPRFEDEFPMDKWNVKIDTPNYTEESYDTHFKSEDWTKEETDHLLQLAEDYDLRWILIADRYAPEDIRPSILDTEDVQQNGSEVVKQYPERTMEALKSRYYQVAAKDLELKTPASNMTQTEFQLWEKMRNFDAKTETLRKNMAEKLFERTKDEADEERTLLEELHRITKNEEEFIRMRKDLYSRLESAPSLRRNERGEEQNIALYQTSSGLSHLLRSLLAKEKGIKRPMMPNGEPGSAVTATPTDQRGRQASQAGRRDTMDSHAGEAGHQKKASISQPVVKQLTPAEQEKYGVSHPAERLTSGVMFRHEKINRITTAKSQVQTQKINAALTELEIPPRLTMPTEKVCREFERLVGNIQLLLDARKTFGRVSEEVKTLEEMRRQRLGLPREGEEQQASTGDAMDVDKSQHASNGIEDTETVDDTQVSIPATVNNGDEETRDASGLDENEGDTTHADESVVQNTEDRDEDAEEEDEDQEIDQSVAQADEDEDEDDAEGEDDDNEVNESSFANRRKDDDNEDEEDDADEDEEQEEEEAELDEDEEETEKLGALARSNDDSDEEEEEEDEAEEEFEEENQEAEDEEDAEEDDEEEEEGDEVKETQPSLANGDLEEEEDEEGGEDDDNDDDGEDGEEVEEPSRPTSSGSAVARSHKRSASVISEASKAGSNRSGIGRKKRR